MALQPVTRVPTSLRPLVANLAHLRLANRKILEVPSVIFMREISSLRSDVRSGAALCLPSKRDIVLVRKVSSSSNTTSIPTTTTVGVPNASFIIPDATLDAFDLKDDPMGTSTISTILGCILQVKNSARKPADELHVPHRLRANRPLTLAPQISVRHDDLTRKVREDTLIGVAESFAARGQMHITCLRAIPTPSEIVAINSKDSNPLTALQSSPGGGKTTVLNMMALLSSNKAWTKQLCPDDALREVLNTSIAVPVTFNSGSDWVKSYDINPSHGLAARILYSFFIKCDKIDFTKFIRLLPADLTPSDAIDACRVFMHSTNPSVPIPPILLLIDETRKTMDVNGDNEVLTSAMGMLLDEYQYNKLNLVCTALDSYLVNKQVTKSKRAVQWVSLNSLQQDDVETMFLQALERDMPSHKDKLPHVERPGGDRGIVLPPSVRLAISDCAGHPRSLEKVQRAFHTLLAEFTSASDWRTKDSLRRLRQLVCKDLGNAVQTPSVDAIRAALVGKQVTQESVIGGMTFADLIAAGTFLNTGLAGDDEAVPKLSMFSLLLFCKLYHKSETKEQTKPDGMWKDPFPREGVLQHASLLSCIRGISYQEEQALMARKGGPSLEGKLFEKFIAAWLQMRLLLIHDADYKTNLGSIFHLDETTTATYSRNISPGKVEFVHLAKDTFESFIDKLSSPARESNEKSPTTMNTYARYADVTNAHKVILFGRNDIDNPGFDMMALIRDTSGKTMCVCIESRFSAVSASTVEKRATIDHKLELFHKHVLERLDLSGRRSSFSPKIANMFGDIAEFFREHVFARLRFFGEGFHIKAKRRLGVSSAGDIIFVNILNRTVVHEDRDEFVAEQKKKLEENVIILDRESVRTVLTPSLADRALFLMDLRHAIDPTCKALRIGGLRANITAEEVCGLFQRFDESKRVNVDVIRPRESEKHFRLPRACVEFTTRQGAEDAYKAMTKPEALHVLGGNVIISWETVGPFFER